jgi:type IV pilus assembly protein PilN
MTELNLIPYHIKEKRLKVLKYRQYASYGILALCVLFMGAYMPGMFLTEIRKQEISLKVQADAGAAVLEESSMIKQDMDNIKSYIEKVDAFSGSRVFAGERIKGIEIYIPKDVAFKSMTYSKGTIVVNAVTNNYNSIGEFCANLQMSGKYAGVRVNSVNSGSDIQSRYSFTINITY